VALSYPAVNLVGSLLSGGVLQRIGEGDPNVPGIDPQSYDLTSGESVRRFANGRYPYLRESFADFADFAERRGRGRHGVRARDDWHKLLLRELHYANIEPLPVGIATDDGDFPVTHWWQRTVPVHLVPWGEDLDRAAGGVRGRSRAAPHAMVQRLLNQSDQHLWGLLSNGQRLRVLRDSTSLASAAYLEFDLEAIFKGDLFPDFVLLFRMAHASRLRVRDEETGPASCLLEEWRAYGARQGERALKRLRGGVEAALETLGTGFLDHTANQHLRESIGHDLSLADFKRSLLRLVYKLIFWMAIEDRDVLLVPDVEPSVRDRYDTYLSSQRIRRLADVRRYSRHGDLWESVKLVFRILGTGAGEPLVGLPALGGVFEPSPLDEPLCGAFLTNADLLRAVDELSVLPQRGGRRHKVDWQHLGAEELGSVYEALLELHPCWDPVGRRFSFVRFNGNDRKKTGAYYTPTTLVEQLLDTTLEPLLDEACAAHTPAERIRNLKEITVCDPACGSGTFLIGAARRIAKRIAIEVTDELEPGTEAVRTALRTVVSRCLHGVDVDELAVELTRVALWLEAVERGKPLGYLDASIRVGNSLLGATPALLKAGIPDPAFGPLEGDDRTVVAALRRQNAAERAGTRALAGTFDVSNLDLAEEARAIAHLAPCESLADVHVQAQRDKALDDERLRRRAVADAWCAAFVAPKTMRTRPYAITQAMVERIANGDSGDDVEAARHIVREMTRQYRFFHWHVEFPHIFRVPKNGNGIDPATGWRGGFSCVLTNPPWERVKLQEQEFFATQSAGIAAAPNAAARKRLVAALAGSGIAEERALHQRWTTALRGASGISHMLRSTGRHPLAGKGDINTYSVFAETSRLILNRSGLLGTIVPTGIATDSTTQYFFKDLLTGRNLVSLFDFENEEKVFTDVDHRVRFCLLSVSGSARPAPEIALAFRVRRVDQIAPRSYTLTPDEITLLNPNTGTCPVFVSHRDAEITLGVYNRVPVLWREDDPEGNPWGISFMAMLHMANDSDLFHARDELIAAGWSLEGNVFIHDQDRMLPLLEAKMVHQFDHRLGTYEGASQAQLNVGTLPRLDEEAHRSPRRFAMPRYWVAEDEVRARLSGRWRRGWLLGWRDICRSTDERTMISTVVPSSAVGDTYLLGFPTIVCAGLQANLSSFVFDYLTRQKASGTHLKYYVVKQLPILEPDSYSTPTPWEREADSVGTWITARVLELTYTAYDLKPYAQDLGDDGAPFVWDQTRRELLCAELDAAYFHLYGLDRADVDYVMNTFKVVRQRDERTYGEHRTKRLILDRYDAMADASHAGRRYRTLLDPLPGLGQRAA
jgi:hypothetical protein